MSLFGDEIQKCRTFFLEEDKKAIGEPETV